MAGEHRYRDLSLTYPHESGVDLPYSVECENSGPYERDGNGGSGASLVYHCNWVDRFKFKEALMGYAEIKGENGSRYLHRVNPAGYHNGYRNAETYENWLYCVDTETTGEFVLPTTVADREEAGITGLPSWPHFKYATIRAQFVSLLHDLKEDEDIVFDEQRREWLRNCIVEDKPGGKYQQDRQQPYKWTDDQTPVKFAASFWDAYEDVVVHWLDVPWVPLEPIRNCIGRVNDGSILKGARGLPHGIPYGCALLVAAEIVVKPKVLNRRYADVTFYIRRVQKPRDPADPLLGHGHNELPKIVEVDVGGGVMKNRRQYLRISLDGTTDIGYGNQLYDEADYDQLFQAPDTTEL